MTGTARFGRASRDETFNLDLTRVHAIGEGKHGLRTSRDISGDAKPLFGSHAIGS